MVEVGPYIEYCGEAYVRESFVLNCVALGLLLVALCHVLVYLVKMSVLPWLRSQRRPRAEKLPCRIG